MTTHVYPTLADFAPAPDGVALSIGNFDGVHRGHRALIALAREQARKRGGLRVAVVTFEPHPLAVLRPEEAPARLTTTAEKVHLLRGCGADDVVILRTDQGLLEWSAERFLREIVDRCRPRVIVEGPTFTFGRGRVGTPAMLEARAAELGYTFCIPREVHADTLPDRPAINSTTVRAALSERRVDRAAALLGRPYRITGRVETGDQRGASLGFATANLGDIPNLLPGHGVYACVAQLEDGRLRRAAVNVGPQPTFDQSGARVEAHLLEFDEVVVGERMGLYFVRHLRLQERFDSVDALRAQLAEDVLQTSELVLDEAVVRADLPLRGVRE